MKSLKRTVFHIIVPLLLALMLLSTWGCLSSDLDNDFNLDSPALLLPLNFGQTGTGTGTECRLDANTFDDGCTFGP